MFSEKFVEHLMPEILVPNLSRSKHFDPGLTPIEKWPGSDPLICPGTYSFFGWSDWAEFGVIRSGIVQLKILPYEIFWSRASLTRYGPLNSKMVIFGCFWNFGQIKSMQIGKSEIAKLKAYRLALIWYQNYAYWTGLRWVMARGVVKDPKTLH